MQPDGPKTTSRPSPLAGPPRSRSPPPRAPPHDTRQGLTPPPFGGALQPRRSYRSPARDDRRSPLAIQPGLCDFQGHSMAVFFHMQESGSWIYSAPCDSRGLSFFLITPLICRNGAFHALVAEGEVHQRPENCRVRWRIGLGCPTTAPLESGGHRAPPPQPATPPGGQPGPGGLQAPPHGAAGRGAAAVGRGLAALVREGRPHEAEGGLAGVEGGTVEARSCGYQFSSSSIFPEKFELLILCSTCPNAEVVWFVGRTSVIS